MLSRVAAVARFGMLAAMGARRPFEFLGRVALATAILAMDTARAAAQEPTLETAAPSSAPAAKSGLADPTATTPADPTATELAEPADPASATEPTVLAPVVVEGRAEDLVGVARSGSEGAVGAGQLETRPILRNAELLEVIPGLVATQHSGSGKANQYFLRGFNLDHGTDFSTHVDGVPMNLPTHAHGQGYLDLNGVIPELVRTVRYNKGPYYAETGDFSSAGSAHLDLFDRLDRGVFKLEGGMHGYGRALLANSSPMLGGDLLYAGDFTYSEGPWELDDDAKRGNALVKWKRGGEKRGVELFAASYAADWNATDQIPLGAVRDGTLSRRGNVDDTDGGKTSRYTLSASAWTSGESWRTHGQLYGVYYEVDLFSNFTYFLDDPVNGDQIHQEEHRGIFGGDVVHEWFGKAWRFDHDSRVGLTLRNDKIPEVALRRTSERELLYTVREDDVNETSIALWADSTLTLHERLRVVPGLRMDGYRFDVDAGVPQNSGSRYDGIVSPKLAIVAGPWADTEAYFNFGGGFHSNDARGTTIEVDPSSGLPVNDVPSLVRTWGYELGVRTQAIEGLYSSLALFLLDLDSELVFAGDAGATEEGPPSRRYGVEWSNYWEPFERTALDLDISYTHARFDVPDPDDEIPGSIPLVISGGITQRFPFDLYAAARLRYLGDYPVVESGDEDAGSTTLVNLRIGWEQPARGTAADGDWAAHVDFLNLFDSHDRDIAYFYQSRFPREAAAAEDIHFHPVEPFAVRVALERRF